MAHESPGSQVPDEESDLSGLRLRLHQGVFVMFLVAGIVMTIAVVTVDPDAAARDALGGPRGGLIALIWRTSLRYLLPLVGFGLAGYTYLYIARRT